jgi:(2Fe-2S) ferredoxin
LRKLVSTLAVALLLTAGAVPAFAGEGHAHGGEEVQLTGYITDEWCGAKNANAEGAGCAKACAKKGAALAIYADGKMYKLSDKEAAMKHVGVQVVVKGTVMEDGTVKVASIEKVEKKA